MQVRNWPLGLIVLHLSLCSSIAHWYNKSTDYYNKKQKIVHHLKTKNKKGQKEAKLITTCLSFNYKNSNKLIERKTKEDSSRKGNFLKKHFNISRLALQICVFTCPKSQSDDWIWFQLPRKMVPSSFMTYSCLSFSSDRNTESPAAQLQWLIAFGNIWTKERSFDLPMQYADCMGGI